MKRLLTLLIVLNIILLATVVYLLLRPNPSDIQVAGRIDINDSTGKNRVVISNEEHIPPPILNGQTFERVVTPAGLIFYDRNGDERGGIAITDNAETNLNALAFDYQNADAVGILAQDNKHDDYFRAGLIINDKGLSGKVGDNTNRINLMTENGDAALVMKDRNEVPRIVLKVDRLGSPSIQLFDDAGNLTWQTP